MEQVEVADVLRYVWAPLIAYVMWEYRNFKTSTDEQVRCLREKVVKLEAEAVTEERLRAVLSDQFLPFHNDNKELKQSIKEIHEGLVELRVKFASGAITDVQAK